MKRLYLLFAAVLFASCGGGGGGGSIPNVSPSSTPTVAPTYTVTGTANEVPSTCDGTPTHCGVTGPANGFAVTIGAIPTSGQGGSPSGTTYKATTSSSGAFSIASVPAGSYELQILDGNTFATLHAKVTVPASASPPYNISALGSGEQAWFLSTNSYRAGKGVGPIVADEYAMETDRAYVNFLVANGGTVCNPGCQSYSQFAMQYKTAGGILNYIDTYRWNILELDCPAAAQSDPNQGPMLADKSAVYGGYGWQTSTPGNPNSGYDACAFSTVSN